MTHKTEIEKVTLDDGSQAYRVHYQCDKEEMAAIANMDEEQKEHFVRVLADEISCKYWKAFDDEVFKRLMYGDTEL